MLFRCRFFSTPASSRSPRFFPAGPPSSTKLARHHGKCLGDCTNSRYKPLMILMITYVIPRRMMMIRLTKCVMQFFPWLLKAPLKLAKFTTTLTVLSFILLVKQCHTSILGDIPIFMSELNGGLKLENHRTKWWIFQQTTQALFWVWCFGANSGLALWELQKISDWLLFDYDSIQKSFVIGGFILNSDLSYMILHFWFHTILITI